MTEKLFLRAFCVRKADEAGQAGEAITFVASTEGTKRDGKDLDASRWNLDNYRRNPVFLWAHDYMGRTLPIGRSDVEVKGKELVATVTFDQADEFARQVEGKYRGGFLNAVSVGWFDQYRCAKCGIVISLEMSGFFEWRLPKECPGCRADLEEKNSVNLEYDLLDVSGVPVPGDANALMEREYAALRSMMEDLSPSPFPLGKGGKDGTGEGLWLETAARMVQLFRPGPDDTDESRLKRYRALLPAYRRAGKVAPEFRTLEELEGLGDEEVAGLFLEGEVDLTPDPFPKGKGNGRVGATLNARNRGDLEEAVTLIQGVLGRAKKEDDDADGDGRTGGDAHNGAHGHAPLQEPSEEEAVLRALSLRMRLVK